jgi:hypothetical protein
MVNDVEVFVGCGRLEICRDRIEVGIRGPFRASGKISAARPELPLADVV